MDLINLTKMGLESVSKQEKSESESEKEADLQSTWSEAFGLKTQLELELGKLDRAAGSEGSFTRKVFGGIGERGIGAPKAVRELKTSIDVAKENLEYKIQQLEKLGADPDELTRFRKSVEGARSRKLEKR